MMRNFENKWEMYLIDFSDNYSEDRIMQQWIDLFKEVNKIMKKTIVISAVNLARSRYIGYS